MAHVTSAEFGTIIRILSDHYGLPPHEGLLEATVYRAGSRSPTNSAAEAPARAPARYAVEVRWQELVSETVNDD